MACCSLRPCWRRPCCPFLPKRLCLHSLQDSRTRLLRLQRQRRLGTPLALDQLVPRTMAFAFRGPAVVSGKPQASGGSSEIVSPLWNMVAAVFVGSDCRRSSHACGRRAEGALCNFSSHNRLGQARPLCSRHHCGTSDRNLTRVRGSRHSFVKDAQFLACDCFKRMPIFVRFGHAVETIPSAMSSS